MKGKYWQKGESLDYVNKSEKKIEYGDVVVMRSRVGIAGTDILPGETGIVHVVGVYEFEKSDTTEIIAGTEVYYTENGAAVEGDIKLGYAAEDSYADSTKVFVKINA